MNNLSNFNGWPTDNSSSTNLKYDIVASKFMNGIENHRRRNAPVQTFGASVGLISAIIKGLIILLFLFAHIVKWACKSLRVFS